MIIQHIITPSVKDLGDFTVKRSLPSTELKMVGPWIFFDHMGPANFPAGKGINARPHPHINLATVTYLFDGEALHRDSLGNVEIINPGDINLMVAGKGIVHSERETDETRNKPHFTHGLQLWHGLPQEHEEIDPGFYNYNKSDIPEIISAESHIRVLIGEAYGQKSPVKTFCQTLYVEAKIQKNHSVSIPHCDEIAVYVVKGKIELDDQIFESGTMVSFSVDSDDRILAQESSHIIFIGGENIGKRYIYWNFASSSMERIEKAKNDWKNKKFPLIESDNEEFIPLPD